MVVHYPTEPQIEDISQRLLREAVPNPSPVLADLVRRGFEQKLAELYEMFQQGECSLATWRSNWTSVPGKPSVCWRHGDCARQTCNLPLAKVCHAHARRQQSIRSGTSRRCTSVEGGVRLSRCPEGGLSMTDETQYHVFLSHNSQDKPAVERLARRLADEGKLRPLLDKSKWQTLVKLDSARY